jgi:hypothetical protein
MDELNQRLNKKPFLDAITYLKENLHLYKSPIDKQRCLTHGTVLITNAILEHYKDIEFAGKQSKLTLDADTLINLCTYVILKCQKVDIYAHLKLAN